MALVVALSGCGSTRSASPAAPPAPVTTSTTPASDRFAAQRDDFSVGTRPNPVHWAVYDAPGTNGVGYNFPDRVRLSEGKLVITGAGDDVGGLCWCGTTTQDYAFGLYEFRVRVDRGTGYSMVVGMWPDSERWPIDGEIDILETPVGDRQTGSVTLHYGADNAQVGVNVAQDFSQWQIMRLNWQPDHLAISVGDDVVFETFDQSQIPQTPMHAFLQLDAANGDHVPYRDATTPDEVRMMVDHVQFTPIPGVTRYR